MFSFSMPFNTVKSNKTEKKASKEVGKTVPRKCKVLVAEDDQISYLFLKNILEGIGITTVNVTNGEAAVEYVRNDSDICMVLMDIKMPVMSGDEATVRIREFNPDIPIIAQTAYAMADDKTKFLQAGCNAYISKPIHKEALLQLIEEFLSQPQK